MDTDTFDPANPFFKYDLNKICGVCTKKLAVAKTYSFKAHISDTEDVMVYQVLESFSDFKLQENGTDYLCQACFNNTCSAYKFQKLCNKTQMFLDKFKEHQIKLSQELQPIEHVKVEEIQINVDDDGKAVGGRKPVKRVPCKVCHKLIRGDNMVVHRRIHTGEKPYKCQHCDASFNQWSSLKYHTASHENKRDYVCQFCALTFNNPGSLRKHEQIHTGDRPHKCTECEMAFTSKHYLQRHAISHTNEKPYMCEYCHKSYNRKTNLTVHQKIHTGERPHLCAICGKSFIQLQSLKSHMQTHLRAATKCKNKEVEEVSGENSSNDAVMEYVGHDCWL